MVKCWVCWLKMRPRVGLIMGSLAGSGIDSECDPDPAHAPLECASPGKGCGENLSENLQIVLGEYRDKDKKLVPRQR